MVTGWYRYIYIPNCKYQVKPHSSPLFTPSCAIAIKTTFFIIIWFCLGNLAIVVKPAKNSYTDKTNESIVLQMVGSCDFWCIANSVLYRGKSALPPLFRCPKIRHLEISGIFSDFQYGFRSSRYRADLLTVVTERTARPLNISGAMRTIALDIVIYYST